MKTAETTAIGRKTPEELLSIGTNNNTKEIEKLIQDKEIDIYPYLDIDKILKIIEIESQSAIANNNLATFAEQYQKRKTESFKDLFSEMLDDSFFQKILAREISIRLIGRGLSFKENKDEVLSYIREEANSIYFNSLNEYASYKDTLTMLWSKTAIEKMLDINLSEGKTPIIVYLDLNQFKEINDTYGHSIGDLILQIFAEKANEIFSGDFRSSDYFGRRSGDEFMAVFVTDGLRTEEERAFFTKKIQDHLKELCHIFVEELLNLNFLKKIDETYISKNPFSAGIYMGEELDHLRKNVHDRLEYRKLLMKIADIALYKAKERKNYDLEIGAIPIVIINQLAEFLN